ncbi:MAG: hypothetical protein CK427_08590 [Leptospira sp.]|nr:MAG: hypothetical protein CK427_08590 [Leptospira sp.]
MGVFLAYIFLALGHSRILEKSLLFGRSGGFFFKSLIFPHFSPILASKQKKNQCRFADSC